MVRLGHGCAAVRRLPHMMAESQTRVAKIRRPSLSHVLQHLDNCAEMVARQTLQISGGLLDATL